MSSTDGAKETWMASTRVKSSPDDAPEYRFRWIKRILDRLFPARTPAFDAHRGVALPARR